MTSPVSGGTGGPLGAAFVDGLSAKQMLVFETLADDYMIEILTQVADRYADLMEAAATLTAAADDISDAAAAGAGAVDPAIFAGVPGAVGEALAVSMVPLVAEVYQSSMGKVRAQMIDELGVTLPPIHSTDAADYLRRAPKVFGDIGDQLQANIRTGLAEGFEAGESIPQLAQRVRDAAGVTARKATLVARTSVISAANVGSMGMAKASGLDMQKEWLATVPTDGRTRPTHIAADGQRVDLHAKFTVGGFECDHPGEYTLPDAEKLGCRCTQGYVIPRAQVMETTEGQDVVERRMRELRARRESLGGRTRTTVTGVDPARVLEPLPPTVAPVNRRLNMDAWGTAADPAMKMTVTQLREILTREGITHIRKADRKEIIVRNLRDWEILHGRTVLPAMPDLGAPAVTTTTRLGQFTARWDNPDPGSPFIGQDRGSHWRRGLSADTGPGGVEVRNLIVQSGYVVDYGRVWRIKGTSYLVETQSASLSASQQAEVLRVLGEMQQMHADIPAADRFNESYAYLLGRNPQDVYWAQQYQMPDFRSAATSGDGTVSIWGYGPAYHLPQANMIKHETGHNVDAMYAARQAPPVGAGSQAWADATRSDVAGTPTAKIKGYQPKHLPGIHPIETALNPSRPFPAGVTAYGKSSAPEDYAESYALYLAGPIARGELPGISGVSDVYFRDLFPARAKIFDDLFPDFAAKQLAEIKAARSPSGRRGAAQGKQADLIDRAGNANDVLTELDYLVFRRSDLGTIEQRLQDGVAAKALTKVEADALRKAFATGDAVKIDAALARVGKKYGLTYEGNAGGVTTMRGVGETKERGPGEIAMRVEIGRTPAEGTQVRVVRRGAKITIDGKTVDFEPMIVREMTPGEMDAIRQAVVDDRTKVAAAVAQLRAELGKGPVSGARVGQIADRNNLPLSVRQALVKAATTSDGLKRAIAAQMKAADVKASGVVNRGVAFDPDTMEVRGATNLDPGTKVKVVETGYVTEIDGKAVVLRRAIVEPIAPKVPGRKAATAVARVAAKKATKAAGRKASLVDETPETDATAFDSLTIEQRIDDIVSGIPARAPRQSRAAVRAELLRQAELVPEAVRGFAGARFATKAEWGDLRADQTERGWAAWSSGGGDFPGQILFPPRWATPSERKIIEGIIRNAYDQRHLAWSFPGYEGGAKLDVIGGIFRHEFGHYISSRWPLTTRGVPWGAQSRRQLLVPLAEELGVPPMPEGGDFFTWFNQSDVQRAIRAKVSDYAADGPDELLAEIWAVYSGRGPEASKLYQRIGKIMADAWRQG